MARYSVWSCLVAAAVGVAPPAMVLPAVPAGQKPASKLGTVVATADDHMSNVQFAPRFIGQPFGLPTRVRQGGLESTLMESLGSASPSNMAISEPHVLHHYSSRASHGKIAMSTAWTKSLGMLALAFATVVVAGSRGWFRHVQNEDSATQMTVFISTISSERAKFAVATLANEETFDPVGLAINNIRPKPRDNEIKYGCQSLYQALRASGSDTWCQLWGSTLSAPEDAEEFIPASGQRRFAINCAVAYAISSGGVGVARAVIKGNAPPKEYGVGKNISKKARCTDREECRLEGFEKEVAEFGASNQRKFSLTSSGARYLDMELGPDVEVGPGAAKVGDEVRIRYRVMRSGKRSSDGLSGEASTIFSLGYGEDDGPKDAVLTVPLGQGKFVKALDEAVVGMPVGGKRRIQVRPENGLGWRKEGQCAEKSAAVGIIAGIPAGGAENEETCLNDKLPQPLDFGSRRRFSRRFDESLIVEVELVGLGAA